MLVSISLEGTAIPQEKQEAALGIERRALQSVHRADAARAALRHAQGPPGGATHTPAVTRYTVAEMMAWRSSPFAQAHARLPGVPSAFLRHKTQDPDAAHRVT